MSPDRTNAERTNADRTNGVGHHHRHYTARDRALRAIELVGRLGSGVTLAALLVVAGAVGGLFDSTPVSSDATVTVTFGHH